MRRAVLVVVSLVLMAVVGAVVVKVIGARIPQQRATLEKLIADRTGLQVRFENVRFSWGFHGTGAVFERVELTDPVRGRVRVVAPELRVEVDTWDFVRHQQLTLGHVTLASPVIEIVTEPDAPPPSPATRKPASTPAVPEADEAAWVRRFTAWAELMPIGRIEVESARVHLLRGTDRVPLHSFTLSQAEVRRGDRNLNAFGTLLLSQDLGQSLFVSARLEAIGAPEGVSGDLRLIARRVLLDKLGFDVASGRGTVDARLELRRGRVHAAEAQASARELDLAGGTHFDHLTAKAQLHRTGDDVLLQVDDLQITRGARLERTPRLAARLSFVPGSVRLDNLVAQSERVPFMAAEFLAAAFAPQLETWQGSWPADWTATAGELQQVRVDWRHRSFEARIVGAELLRSGDGARIGQFSARLWMNEGVNDGRMNLEFDAAAAASVVMPPAAPRAVRLAGRLSWAPDEAALDLTAVALNDGTGSLRADGSWGRAGRPLLLEFAEVDRTWLAELTRLVTPQLEWPALQDIDQGRIVAGQMRLLTTAGPGAPVIDWQRSRGSMTLADLAGSGERLPRLTQGGGDLQFSRAGTRLRLTSGHLADLQVTGAKLDWPRRGAPRLQATLRGELPSSLVRDLLQEQGLEAMSGSVSLEADARGREALTDPGQWRITAHLEGGSLPLAAQLPPAQQLSGTVRYANRQLRALSLEGSWLGGPLKIEGRRPPAGSPFAANVSGVADAAPLLELLGHADVARQVDGTLAWSGTLQRLAATGPDAGGWRVSLNSTLAGLESRLPEPFDKPRTRPVAMHAELRLDAQGVREFDLASGTDAVRGRIDDAATVATFTVRGVSGDWSAAREPGGASRLTLERLDVRRAPLVLAAAGAWLPEDSGLRVQIGELRHASRALGSLQAELARRDAGLEFTLESGDGPHEFGGAGSCRGDAHCQLEFSFGTQQLASLLEVQDLPAEWPRRAMRVTGAVSWTPDASNQGAKDVGGQFEFEVLGQEDSHQLTASATLADDVIELSQVQGSGPAADQIFRGSGRVGLQARTYDVILDYERVSLAASAMPSPARAGLAHAWSMLRGSAARRGWAESPPPRRVQWHGTWD